jgi:predicted NodU family carbamoyl transferase
MTRLDVSQNCRVGGAIQAKARSNTRGTLRSALRHQVVLQPFLTDAGSPCGATTANSREKEEHMAEIENIALYRRLIEEGVGVGNLQVLDETLSPDIELPTVAPIAEPTIQGSSY